MDLGERLEELGRLIGEREAPHDAALERARAKASELRTALEAALDRFHTAIHKAGAPHLAIELGPLQLDDKHIRAIEFDLRRGRRRAIVTVKSRGEVTLVGPFRIGRNEGPCRTFPFEAKSEIETALCEFLERFLEEAMTP